MGEADAALREIVDGRREAGHLGQQRVERRTLGSELGGVILVVVEARDHVGPQRIDDDPEHVVGHAGHGAREQRRRTPERDGGAGRGEHLVLRAGVGILQSESPGLDARVRLRAPHRLALPRRGLPLLDRRGHRLVPEA